VVPQRDRYSDPQADVEDDRRRDPPLEMVVWQVEKARQVEDAADFRQYAAEHHRPPAYRPSRRSRAERVDSRLRALLKQAA